MVTQKQIARRVGLDVSSVNKILNRKPGPVFKPATIKKVLRTARELGYDLSRLKHPHHRDHRRKQVALPLELTVYLENGVVFDRGTAILLDISLSGALLSAIVLPQHAIPLTPHTIGLRMLEGPLKDLEIIGRPVRFSNAGPSINLAVEFLKTEDAKIDRLRKLV